MDRSKELTAPDRASGDTSRALSAIWDPGSCSWKTPQTSLVEASEPSSPIFTGSGSMRAGVCSLRPPLVAPKPAPGCFYWPTPAASVPNNGESPFSWLTRWVRNLSKTTGATCAGVPLSVAAIAPTVRGLAKRGTLKQARARLAQAVEDPADPLHTNGTLNPDFSRALMGFPIGWLSEPSETP